MEKARTEAGFFGGNLVSIPLFLEYQTGGGLLPALSRRMLLVFSELNFRNA